ncbi:hypothetical protein Acr_28g0003960 [Actinidia rufa]|uniref:HAT C-terminal dimerisation domain-containing protein n=1 Tax=Actinidia rufa TaxID=165716 RepID=A0A7J0H9R2_9ERIC|nr:hypothetical protein Acr_28g0003960 [Actinidia rufa]
MSTDPSQTTCGEDDDGVELDEDVTQDAHILNLIVQDGLAVIGSLISKIRESVRYIRRSVYAKQKFDLVVNQVNLNGRKRFPMDVPTRWSSTYETVEEAISLKVELLFHIKHFFPGYMIQLQLKKWGESENGFLHLMTVPMSGKFEKYWEEGCLVLAIAVVLHPRYKLALVEYYFDIIYGEDVAMYGQRVHIAFLDLFNEYRSDSPDSRPSWKHDSDAFCSSGSQSLPSSSKAERLAGFHKCNVKFPTLARIVRNILAVPATTVASDAAFSVEGRMIDETRASLLSDIVEALVKTNDWTESRKKRSEIFSF